MLTGMVTSKVSLVTVKAENNVYYDRTAAVDYASNHWNDGVGECAQFVSACISAGGISVSQTVCLYLWNTLKDYGTPYKLTSTNPSGNGHINLSANSGKVEAGDPLFYVCEDCGGINGNSAFPHVVICGGTDSSGNLTAYAHNAAWNNETIWTQLNSSEHPSHNFSVFSIHIENKEATQEPTVSIIEYHQEHTISDYLNKNEEYSSSYFDGNGVPLDGSNGTPDMCIPGLSEEDDMIPQGITYYGEKNWLLISAYASNENVTPDRPSMIYALDFDTGEYVAEFKLYNSDGSAHTKHVGGIAASDNNLYITTENSTISYISLSELNVETGTSKSLTFNDSFSVSAILNGAPTSHLSFSDGYLWTGNFYHTEDGYDKYPASETNNSVVIGFNLNGSNSDDEWSNLKSKTASDYTFKIPNYISKIQGTAVSLENETMVLISSYTRTANSVVYTLKFSGSNILDSKITYCGGLPMLEGAFVLDDYVYTVTESGSYYYHGFDSQNLSQNPTDVVWKFPYNQIKDSENEDNISIMSYNIYSYNKEGYSFSGYSDDKDYTYAARVKYIINNIVDNTPDSIGFQEITEEFRICISTSQDNYGRSLENYAWANTDYRDDDSSSDNNEGCLILYNAEKYELLEEDTFWLNENGEKYEIADEWNAGYIRICSYAVLKNKNTGFTYVHFNTHIDHNAPAAINSVNKILDFINENYADTPAVLTGDFNHQNDTDVYETVINSGFTDVNTANDTTFTYHEYNRGQYSPKIIDFIFINKYFSASSYKVYDKNYSSNGLDVEYASDHHPIVTELTYVEPIEITGSCGDVTWTLNAETGELFVYGIGSMWDWGVVHYYNECPPWCYCYTGIHITSVIIGNGVTSIGSAAFCDSIKLKKITIPNSVTSIGQYAFNGCRSLSSIIISDNVTFIGDCAFGGCDSLTSINVNPSNTRYSSDEYGVLFNKDKTELIQYPIGNSRTSYEIPASATSITSDAFAYCKNLTSIYVNPSNTRYSSDEYGVLFNKDKTELIQYPIGNTRTRYDIPDSVTILYNAAFYDCYSLKTLSTGNGLTWFYCDFLFHRSNLSELIIGYNISSVPYCSVDSLTSIYVDPANAEYSSDEYGVLFNKNKTELIRYPVGNTRTSYEIPYTVTSISDNAFTMGINLTSIYVAPANAEFSSDECGVLFNKDKTELIQYPIGNNRTSYEIPDGVININSYAFYSCFSLETINIPESVAQITDSFVECRNLTNIYVDSNNASYSSDEDGVLFNKDKTELIQYPIGNDRIYYAIPNGISYIEYGAFGCCSNLIKIVIPSSLSLMSYNAFYDLDNLTDVYYNGTQNEWYRLTNELTIEFDNKKIHYADKGEKIAGSCGKSIIWFYDKSAETLFLMGSNDMYNWPSSYDVPWSSYSSYIKSIIIDNEVTSIGDYAFYDCENLATVNIPKNITNIGESAFDGCTSLQSVSIPASVVSIGDLAFADSVKAIYVDDGNPNYSSDENGVLFNKSKTELIQYPTLRETAEFTVPDGVTRIGKHSFYSCSNLTDITILEGVTDIGCGAFMYCESLTSVTIPHSVTNIGEDAFYYCNSLSDVYYAGSCEDWELITIGDYNTGLMFCLIHATDGDLGISIQFDETTGELTISGKGAMPEYSIVGTKPWAIYEDQIKSVRIEEGVTTICADAFYDCSNLTTVFIPDSIISIGNYAFCYCTSLTSITIGSGVTSIGSLVFAFCSEMTSFVIPEGVTTLEYGVFGECESLASLTIPKTVTYIDEYAFYECASLSDVYYTGTKKEWSSIEIVNEENDCLLNANIHASDGLIGTSWNFNESTGTLTISGDGPMKDYSFESYEDSPWYSFKEDIIAIVIEEGVTSVGDFSFVQCSNATSVSIPESLINIGNYAFLYCYSLIDVIIPNSVKSIGDYAFYFVMAMEYIHIPSSVTEIGERFILTDTEKASLIQEINSILETGTEEELAEYASMGVTKENASKWKPTTLICSDTEDCYAREYAEANGYTFVVCNGHNTEEHTHSYTSTVTKDASCTETGLITYICECGDSYTEDVAKVAHVDADWEIVNDSTCTTRGKKIKKCTVCGNITRSESIPFASHFDSNKDGLCDICDKISN